MFPGHDKPTGVLKKNVLGKNSHQKLNAKECPWENNQLPSLEVLTFWSHYRNANTSDIWKMFLNQPLIAFHWERIMIRNIYNETIRLSPKVIRTTETFSPKLNIYGAMNFQHNSNGWFADETMLRLNVPLEKF